MEQSQLIAQLVPFLTRRGYEPGERIPSERELAVRFEASRGQVRDVLALLETLRIVERRSKSGLFMAAEVPSVEAMALFARIGIPLDERDIAQTVEMRRIHEVEAVRLACARRTASNIERMREILAASEAAVEHVDVVADHDRLFHTEIVRATQNDVFLRIVNIFYLMSEERRIGYFRDVARRRRSQHEHREIFEAIAAEDAARAVTLVEAHLQGVDSYWRHFVDAPATADAPVTVEAPDGRRAR